MNYGKCQPKVCLFRRKGEKNGNSIIGYNIFAHTAFYSTACSLLSLSWGSRVTLLLTEHTPPNTTTVLQKHETVYYENNNNNFITLNVFLVRHLQKKIHLMTTAAYNQHKSIRSIMPMCLTLFFLPSAATFSSFSLVARINFICPIVIIIRTTWTANSTAHSLPWMTWHKNGSDIKSHYVQFVFVFTVINLESKRTWRSRNKSNTRSGSVEHTSIKTTDDWKIENVSLVWKRVQILTAIVNDSL